MGGPFDPAEVEIHEGQGVLPSGASQLTTLDYDNALPGFAIEISAEDVSESGGDVILDWSGVGGFYDEVIIYRSEDPNLLLDIDFDSPLPPGVDEEFAAFEDGQYIDFGAASQFDETPNYYYRVGLVLFGEGGNSFELSTMVMKTTTAIYAGYSKFSMCMLGGAESASDFGELLGDSVIAVYGWDAVNQSYLYWNPASGAGSPGDFPLGFGQTVSVQLDGSNAPYQALTGVVPTDEAFAVASEPGNNWMTVPPLYDGPTTASYWVDEVGYTGMGRWNNDMQNASWYWGAASGSADIDLEACRPYYTNLPATACTSNDECDDGFCFYVPAAACGERAAGLCFPNPMSCEGAELAPVCGCDGQTYESQCAADLASVGVASEGECATCELTFDFENAGATPLFDETGGWQLYSAAPPSEEFLEVPFGSQVLGTDGNRVAPYPGEEAEDSSATLGPITLGAALSFRSWHVDEGGDPDGNYDRKRIYFDSADTGETMVLVDCNDGINTQEFCNYLEQSRPGDEWDTIVLDTSTLDGQTGNLRFEYETLDSCCSFEQGWFIDDITVGSCGEELTGGPPQAGPEPGVCPEECLNLAMYQEMVLNPIPADPIDFCNSEDYGDGGDANISSPTGDAGASWNDGGGEGGEGFGQCTSNDNASGEFLSVGISPADAQACAMLIEDQGNNFGLFCGDGGEGPV